MPNSAQLLSALRSFLTGGGSAAVALGWANDSQIALWSGIILAVAPSIWGLFVHSTSGQLAAVAAIPVASLPASAATLPQRAASAQAELAAK